MSTADDYDYDDYSEYVDCWQCGGEGGWNSCMEDTCCALGGEEGCNDPLCWRRCDICKGEGGWDREEPSTTQATPVSDKAQHEGEG